MTFQPGWFWGWARARRRGIAVYIAVLMGAALWGWGFRLWSALS